MGRKLESEVMSGSGRNYNGGHSNKRINISMHEGIYWVYNIYVLNKEDVSWRGNAQNNASN